MSGMKNIRQIEQDSKAMDVSFPWRQTIAEILNLSDTIKIDNMEYDVLYLGIDGKYDRCLQMKLYWGIENYDGNPLIFEITVDDCDAITYVDAEFECYPRQLFDQELLRIWGCLCSATDIFKKELPSKDEVGEISIEDLVATVPHLISCWCDPSATPENVKPKIEEACKNIIERREE